MLHSSFTVTRIVNCWSRDADVLATICTSGPQKYDVTSAFKNLHAINTGKKHAINCDGVSIMFLCQSSDFIRSLNIRHFRSNNMKVSRHLKFTICNISGSISLDIVTINFDQFPAGMHIWRACGTYAVHNIDCGEKARGLGPHKPRDHYQSLFRTLWCCSIICGVCSMNSPTLHLTSRRYCYERATINSLYFSTFSDMK